MEKDYSYIIPGRAPVVNPSRHGVKRNKSICVCGLATYHESGVCIPCQTEIRVGMGFCNREETLNLKPAYSYTHNKV
jgi:hypothetical protein